jgi:phage terminase large subunit
MTQATVADVAPHMGDDGALVQIAPAHALDAPKAFDWRNPDYVPIWGQRARVLQKLAADPSLVADFKVHYKWHPWDMVNDWGVTVDPRVASIPGRTPLMPFLLMPKQVDWMIWAFNLWQGKLPDFPKASGGTTVKSRDCGISWCFMTFGIALCLTWRNINIGVGSAKADKVDRTGDPDCLFYKGRMFLRYLPPVFKNGWSAKRDSKYMVLEFPYTECAFTGEAGDNIGRGGRTAIYGIDESAHLERPKLVDASLSATTNCRIDISSVNGSANSFAERAHNAHVPRFDFSWRDDPRKDQEWYDQKCRELDPVVVSQEIDCNFNASVDGIIIPQAHVQAAIDLDYIIGIEPTGRRQSGLDISDLGKDKCALADRYGYLLERVVSWRGNGIIDGRQWEPGDSVALAYHYMDETQTTHLIYDADGMGALCREPMRKLNIVREEERRYPITFHPFRATAPVIDPEKPFPGTQRKAIDYFENYKAQSWWWLRRLFAYTYSVKLYWDKHKKLPEDFTADNLIVIRGSMAERTRLCMELSQPVWVLSKHGKIMVDKTPDEVPSPNLADAVMMVYAPKRMAVIVKDHHLNRGN